MTRQEMFDRAVRGLRSQGLRKAVGAVDRKEALYVYETADGRRCAWGWVDRSLTREHSGTVSRLHCDKIGIAGELDLPDVEWARGLQQTHDGAEPNNPADLERRLREFGEKSGLVWPEETP